MGIIGAAEAQFSNTLLLSNKLNASYRQDDYFFFFSFSSAAAVKSFMACSPVDLPQQLPGKSPQ
jgi:hypothetical protein